MHKSFLLYLLLFSFLFSCNKDTDQIIQEEQLPCGVPVSLAPDSSFEYAYYCDSEASQTLHIFTPQNWEEEANLPCIIYFHGAIGNAYQYFMQSAHFAERGMVAISVNHRFTFTESYDFNGLKDSHSAIRWVKENRLLLGVDTSKIAVSGSSGGGTAALSCFVKQFTNHVTDDLTISINPAAMIVTNPHLVNIIEVPSDASEHPATLFLQGDSDEFTPLDKLESYISNVLSRGAPEIGLIIYKGRGHGFFNYDISPEDYFNTLMRADTFLVDHGFLPDYYDQSK